jgi:NADH-quinone oxidoreductase subunit C
LIEKGAVREVIAFLRDDDKMLYNFLRDITCVDYLRRAPRFEVVYVLYSMERKQQVVVKAAVPEEDPVVPSIHRPLWLRQLGRARGLGHVRDQV